MFKKKNKCGSKLCLRNNDVVTDSVAGDLRDKSKDKKKGQKTIRPHMRPIPLNQARKQERSDLDE